MNIRDHYSWKNITKRENNPLLPQNIRGLIIGKSNCGKTTLLFNLLLRPGWLDYNHLEICIWKKFTPTRVQNIKKRFRRRTK